MPGLPHRGLLPRRSSLYVCAWKWPLATGALPGLAAPPHFVKLRVRSHVHEPGHPVGEAEERSDCRDVPRVVIARADGFELGELFVGRGEARLVDARSEGEDCAQARREVGGPPV